MKSRFDEVYEKIINEQVEGLTFQKISNEEIQEVSDTIEVTNPIANIKQVTKHKGGTPGIFWYVSRGPDKKIKSAIGAIEHEHNSLEINTFEAFTKKTGAPLLHYVLDEGKYDIIYLNSDWSVKGEKLNDYYRKPEFDLTEKTITRENGDVIHFFYKNFSLSDEELEEFIKNNFK